MGFSLVGGGTLSVAVIRRGSWFFNGQGVVVGLPLGGRHTPPLERLSEGGVGDVPTTPSSRRLQRA